MHTKFLKYDNSIYLKIYKQMNQLTDIKIKIQHFHFTNLIKPKRDIAYNRILEVALLYEDSMDHLSKVLNP